MPRFTTSETTSPSGGRRRRLSALIALGATGALTLGLAAAPTASAVSGPQPPATPGTVAAPVGPAPALSPTAQAIADAKTKAKATGKAVQVDALTTESSSTVVNPNGTLTTTDFAGAVRVKQAAGWADINATLHANGDGTLSPAATQAGLKLSGGGTGPLATVTTNDGSQLSVTAPFALPAPTLSGDTATYANVLKDVDLRVTALADGGWRDVIVVKTAAAAADPALRTLHFPITGKGLTSSTDAAGNISFKDAGGKVKLHAPTPMQWDSTLPAPFATGAATVPHARSLFAAPSASTAPAAGTSSSEGPGDNAKVAPIGVKTSADGIDLTPDQTVLGKGSGPWYIDPTVTADSGTQNWVQVQENHPDTQNFNANSPVGVGYCGYSDCSGYGRYRGYFTIGINSSIYNQPSGAPSPPTVYGSTFYATVSDASSPSTNTPFGLYWTGPIGQGTTWNSQPCGTNGTMAGCGKVGNSFWLTGTGGITFDVTSQLQQAASQHWGNWTVGIAPDDENNMYYRHHISISAGSQPHIVTNYDLQPSAWAPSTSPAPGFASTNTTFPCSNPTSVNPWDNVGWIGANQSVKLSVNTWSPPPANFSLHTAFNIFWQPPGGSQGNYNQDSGYGGSWNVDAGAQNTTLQVSQLQDGQVYGWHAGAYDDVNGSGGLGSPWTPLCYFGVDRTPPTVSITSADFPPSGTANPKPAKYAGQTGNFVLHGSDPVPANGAASGLACYRWSTDPSPATGWKCTDGTAAGVYQSNGNNSVTIPYTPGNWGTNIIYAQAQDQAGNYSQPAAYAFYAPWNPNSKAVFGDTTGDGKPDIVIPDGSGNLKLVSTGTDPANSTSARASLAPPGGTKGWSGLQLTHRGSLSANITVDDLIAHAPNSPDLYQILNDGTGNYQLPTTVGAMPNSCIDFSGKTISCPASFTAVDDWSKTTQVVAIGKPEGENNTPTSVSRTSLIAVVENQLWLFHGGAESDNLPTDYFDGTARQLSSADWSNYDLINPGPAAGNNQPTLWARNRTDGSLRAYTITGGATPVYTDFTNPATSGFSIGTATVANYPTIGSSGDVSGDGVADLWATTPSGQLVIWPGVADATGKVISFKFPGTDTLVPSAGHWKLNEANGATKVADLLRQDPTDNPTAANTTAFGAHPGTATNVTFASDTPTGLTDAAGHAITTNVAVFNGSSSKIETAGPIVDTTRSFTVNAWAKPSSGGGVVVSQDGNTTAGFMIWPDGNTWKFAMAATDGSGWPYNVTSGNSANTNSNANVQYGVWTHLTASYDSISGQMALWVNGALAGTATHAPGPAFNGNFTIGRWQNSGNKSTNFFNGSISDVSVTNTVAFPGSNTGAISVSSVSNKCVDLANNSATPGNVVQVYDCNGSPAQKWTFNVNGTLNIGGGCLDATNAGTGNGTLVQWQVCNGNAAQIWLPRADGSIYNPVSGRCLDDPASNLANGTRFQLYDCNGTPAQRWTIAPAA
jgi:hypothetical protein